MINGQIGQDINDKQIKSDKQIISTQNTGQKHTENIQPILHHHIATNSSNLFQILPNQSQSEKQPTSIFLAKQQKEAQFFLFVLLIFVHLARYLLLNAYFSSLAIIFLDMLKQFYIKKQFFVTTRDQNIKEHYEILEIVGRGAFGIVYKAKMRYYPYSIRAVKRIKKQFIKNPADIIKQYSVLTSFDHPQIIKIYETFQDEDNFFLVLDFCEGGELFSRLQKQGNFSEGDARTMFSQMVNIINYCHQNKVAHRDLKPQNFLLVSKNSLDLMLIDFGLCFKWKRSVRQEIVKLQGKNTIVGTAYYMAPEIFKGIYDQRCDIWSLGIILFMLTTGQPPVSGITYEQILANIQQGKLNLEVLNQKKLSSNLVELILRMLSPQDVRIGIKDIIKHPWMTMKLSDRKLNINFEKIRSYSKFSKFKVLVLNYIASQLSQKDIMVLGKIFLEIDKNKDGYLTIQQLSTYMETQEIRQQFGDIRDIIQYMDVDHNGKLAYNEFISACLSKSTANNRDYLSYAFKYFDLNHDGTINREQLAIILRAYKKEYAENSKLIDKLLEECDLNGDSQIDFQEFVKYMQKGYDEPFALP